MPSVVLIKDMLSLVDDTLGLDTRDTIKGLVENGVMIIVVLERKNKSLMI